MATRRRCRRKKQDKKKCELLFEESPKEGINNLPSPVRGARCPPTADVVPIDDSFSLTWVSPQFRHNAGDITRKKRHNSCIMQQRLNTRASHKSQLSFQAPSSSSVPQSEEFRLKYRALDFLCDSSSDDDCLPIHHSTNADTNKNIEENMQESTSPSFKDGGSANDAVHRSSHLFALCFNNSSGHSTESCSHNVLVCDTPEHDYGVTRKMKSLLRLKRLPSK